MLEQFVVAKAMLTVGAAVTAPAFAAEKMQAGTGALDRSVLPIAEPKRPVYKELDARKVKAPPHFEVKAPAAAPNVVIILIDDLGFGAPSTFGGPIATVISPLNATWRAMKGVLP